MCRAQAGGCPTPSKTGAGNVRGGKRPGLKRPGGKCRLPWQYCPVQWHGAVKREKSGGPVTGNFKATAAGPDELGARPVAKKIKLTLFRF